MGATSTNLCPAFGQLGEGQRAFLVSASSRLPSPENKPTKAACLGLCIVLSFLPRMGSVGLKSAVAFLAGDGNTCKGG